jgi:hypothetical protein
VRRRHQLLFGGLIVTLVSALPGARPATAASMEVVAVVIDFGTGGGAHRPIIECVHEPQGATSGQALNDALAKASLPLPSYDANGSGLLCSLGNYPAQGCGVQTPSGYQYWAYFHGDGTGWHYAQDGPNERAASGALTEGWHFEDRGRGNPSDPPPTGTSSPSQLCASATPTTAPVVPTTSVPTPGPLPVTTAPHREVTTTSTTPRPSKGSTTTVTAPAPARGQTGSSSTTTAGAALAAEHGSSGPSAGALVALGLVAVGGVTGAVLWRRRRV